MRIYFFILWIVGITLIQYSCGTSKSTDLHTSSQVIDKEEQRKIGKLIFELYSNEPVTSGSGITQYFEIDEPTIINMIITYHWNNGEGAQPGFILLVDMEYNDYGSWEATGIPDDEGRKNIYWKVTPNIQLDPGMYGVLVSDLDSWASNESLDYCGMHWVYGSPVAEDIVVVESELKKEPEEKKNSFLDFLDDVSSALDDVSEAADEVLDVLEGKDEEELKIPQTNQVPKNKEGAWVHYDTKVINGCEFYQHECYKVLTCENSNGSIKVRVRPICEDGPLATLSGTYTPPPKRIVPGKNYKFETSPNLLNVNGLMHIWAGLYDNISFEKEDIILGARSYEEIIVTSDAPCNGEIILPEDLDKNFILLFCAGAGIGTSSIRANSFYLYKWEE